MELEFEIDKITESIEDAETGESFDTLVLPVDKADLRGVTKKNGWHFNWKLELAETDMKIYLNLLLPLIILFCHLTMER